MRWGMSAALILAVMAGAVFLQVVLRFLGSGRHRRPRRGAALPVRLAGHDRRGRGDAARPAHRARLFRQPASAARPRALVLILVNAGGIALFLYLIKLSFVLVPNAQLQTSAGLGLPLG